MKRKDRELSWYQTWFGEFVIAILFGSVVTYLRWKFQEPGAASPSAWTMVATFLGTTMAGMIFSIMKRVAKLEVDVREHNEELAAAGEIDGLLLQLQARLREVQANRSAVFKTYCRQELEHFATRVARAAQHGELIVNEHQFSTVDHVLEAFGGTNRVFRGVWKIEEGERLFDTAWQHYMEELVKLTKLTLPWQKTKRITVELLLVVDKQETLNRRAVEIVVGYLRPRKTKGLNYRIIKKETYEELARDSQLDTGYIDFGVYGEALLYRTKTYEPKQGMFSEDKGTIQTYEETHEAAMRNAKELPHPAGAIDHDDLKRFLDADEIEEREREKKRDAT